MKVALVHDYLREYGGAERVLEELHSIFPEAPIFVAYYNQSGLGVHASRFANWKIIPSFFQKFPMANKLVSPMRLFAPMMFESFDLKDYDVVISSCNIYFSKAVITKPETLHISYIHTPPRYLYGYATSFNYKKKWWTRIGGEIINHILRLYDFETSQRPDILVANSKNVAERIKKFYRREATVVYPPVDVERFKRVKKQGGEYFLALNRLVRGKGTEVIVEACSKLDVHLKVVGGGPELQNLKKVSGRTVEFLGEVRDEELPGLYARAKALIVASEDEDFGITAVEAQACGTPVIAVKKGGYLETVVPGKTGEFYNSSTPDELTEILEKFNPAGYKAEDCIKQAEKFSKEEFKKHILKLVGKKD